MKTYSTATTTKVNVTNKKPLTTDEFIKKYKKEFISLSKK